MRKQTKIVALASAAALLTIGAAMTSFAAAEWKVEDGEWVYVDKYGDRVYNTWKKSGNDYYYLGDDGVMVTDQVITDGDSDGNIYYVDSSGKKATNRWVEVDNEDDVTLKNGDEVDSLWYYFDSKGKAIKADTSKEEYKKKSLPISTGSSEKAYFLFDENGYMMSGWVDDDDDTYYLGEENEGWAKTGWQNLEPRDDEESDPYEDSNWYWFSSKGIAVKDQTKYIDGRYYSFNVDGVMDSGWFTLSTPPTASGVNAYTHSGGNMGTGWVKTTAKDDENGDEHWYYLINEKVDGKVKATVPFNFKGSKDNDDGYAAKSIKSKVYLFEPGGAMKTGVVTLTDVRKYSSSDTSTAMPDGIYYFNKTEGSTEGQMMTGRVTVDNDGENEYYHFKKDGTAYTNAIKNNILYDGTGKRVDSDEGYMITPIDDCEYYKGSSETPEKVTLSGYVAVNSSGRVKTSNGDIKIDGDTWHVTFNTTTGVCSVVRVVK